MVAGTDRTSEAFSKEFLSPLEEDVSLDTMYLL
jgi:hypothetical protein